jgi:hypothetical protein
VWSVNGTVVSATKDELDGLTSFDKNDTVSVTVTPKDSESGASVTSALLTVVNTLPEAPELALTPSEPSATDDVVCEVDYQEPDLDGDVLTYTVAWEQNGVAFTGADTTTLTGDTILAEDRDEDDVWVCTVTPFDGDDFGVAGRVALGTKEPTGLDFTGATVHKSTPQGGTESGSNYDDKCGTGEVLVGFSGTTTSSPYIGSVATRCAPMTFSCSGTTCTAVTGTIATGTLRGGSGTSFTRDCASGSVVTGFVSRAGWYMDQIVLRCAPITAEYDGADWAVSLGTTTDLSAIGGTGGGLRSRSDCLTGEVATSAQIKASTSLVMTIGFGCQEAATTP